MLFFFSFAYISAQTVKQSPAANKIHLSLTHDEEVFIAEHPMLHVVCEPQWPPFEYYNTSLDVPQFSGINISILKRSASIVGIDLDFIPTQDYFQSMELMKNGKADLISGYVSQIKDIPSLLYTDGMYSIPFVLLSTTGHQPVPGETIVCGQIAKDELLAIQKSYPADRYRYRFYKDPQKALSEIEKRHFKYAFLDEYEVEDYPNLPPYNLFYLDVDYVQRFAFSEELGQTAVDLFNKAYRSISPEEFEAIVYSSQVERRYLQKEMVSDNKNRMTIGFYVGIIAILLAIITIVIIVVILKRRPHIIEYDDVTGIPTYAKFKRDVRIKLRNAKPDEFMFLSIDIDNFSYINDSYSFDIGNALLFELSQHFKEECEKNSALICRFYADNFIVFAKNPGYLGVIEDQVCRLTDVSDHVRKLLPQQYNLMFSSGVYYIADPTADITSMIDKANIARRLGKENFATHRVIEYTKEMNDESELKKNITLTMNKAIENNEFVVFFQPKFLFTTEVPIGAEALIRWNNPDSGMMQPAKFIPLFEKNGFIQKIDLYVFEKVCHFIDSWNRSGPDKKCPHPITISFNLSRNHLYNPDLINELTSIMSRYQIEPCKIEVELTESIMFDNQKRLVRAMNEIKNAGFDISVDDFGSGYSSLNLLKDMPADVLKLDKEFLSSAPDNERESIIITSVINMAKKLNLMTVAEGVETKKQSDLLKSMGCDLVQGFYYAKPMPENDFKLLLQNVFLK